eukprot:16333725-Heterocapsa_arctica.AAC.1
MKWHGDHSIPSFIFLWRHIVSRMRVQLPEELLMDTLHSEMTGSAIMAHDLSYFNRQDVGHPDISYEYLLKCMDKCIGLQQQALNRDAASKAIRAGHTGGVKGAPAINGEGLSKTAKKKAAKAAKALAATTRGSAPGKGAGKGAGKGKGKPDAATSGEAASRPIC